MEKSINIQTEGGDVSKVSGLVAGDINGVVNSGEVSGSITNTINRNTSLCNPEQYADIKSLLNQLKLATESESTLSQEDRVEALEQIEILTAASQSSENVSHQKVAKRAIKIVKGTVVGLPTTANLVETCSELLPEIEAYLLNKDSSKTKYLAPHPVGSQLNTKRNNSIKPTVILFLASDPTDASRLRLGTELREIQESLQLAKLRDEFRLEQRMSVRSTDISQSILDVNPQIIHFSGHGTGEDGLCFENKLGELQLVQADALAALFSLVSEQVDCVLLNACYSEVQAQAIATHIKYVIGMNKAIGDEAAISFSIGFYQAIGAGRSITEAYKFGCVQISLQGIPEYLTPVLMAR